MNFQNVSCYLDVISQINHVKFLLLGWGEGASTSGANICLYKFFSLVFMNIHACDFKTLLPWNFLPWKFDCPALCTKQTCQRHEHALIWKWGWIFIEDFCIMHPVLIIKMWCFKIDIDICHYEPLGCKAALQNDWTGTLTPLLYRPPCDGTYEGGHDCIIKYIGSNSRSSDCGTV